MAIIWKWVALDLIHAQGNILDDLIPFLIHLFGGVEFGGFFVRLKGQVSFVRMFLSYLFQFSPSDTTM